MTTWTAKQYQCWCPNGQHEHAVISTFLSTGSSYVMPDGRELPKLNCWEHPPKKGGGS